MTFARVARQALSEQDVLMQTSARIGSIVYIRTQSHAWSIQLANNADMQTAEQQGCAIATSNRDLFWLLTIAKLLHGVDHSVQGKRCRAGSSGIRTAQLLLTGAFHCLADRVFDHGYRTCAKQLDLTRFITRTITLSTPSRTTVAC